MGLFIAVVAAIPLVAFLIWLIPARQADLDTIDAVREARAARTPIQRIDAQIAELVEERARYTYTGGAL